MFFVVCAMLYPHFVLKYPKKTAMGGEDMTPEIPTQREIPDLLVNNLGFGGLQHQRSRFEKVGAMDQFNRRQAELVAEAENQGIFSVIDKHAQNILETSGNLEQAADILQRSRGDILDELRYHINEHTRGLPNAELNNIEEAWRVANEEDQVRRQARPSLRSDWEERKSNLQTRRLRDLDYNPLDRVGNAVPRYEKDRPSLTYRDIKHDLKTAQRGEPEYQEALDKRDELIKYYSKHDVVDRPEVKRRVMEILENSDNTNVSKRLRRLQKEVEEGARSRKAYREDDYGFVGSIISGVVAVGDASVKIAKNDPNRAEWIERVRERRLMLNIPQGEIDNAFREKEKYPETQAEWVLMIHRKLVEAEQEAVRNLEKSNERPQIWNEIEQDIKHAKEHFKDNRGDRHDFLSRQFADDYPDGVYFPELLELYTSARADFVDRYVEVHPNRSKGSLTLLGRVDEMPFEGIRIHLQELSGMTDWMIIHNDEIFRDTIEAVPDSTVPAKEKREILADIDAGLCVWWDVGVMGYRDEVVDVVANGQKKKKLAKGKGTLALFNPEYNPSRNEADRDPNLDYVSKGLLQDVVQKELEELELEGGGGKFMEALENELEGIADERMRDEERSKRLLRAIKQLESKVRVPTYTEALTSASDMARLRSLVAKKLETEGQEGLVSGRTAWMMHSVKFSVDLWDKDRKSVSLAGKADMRDMIHFDRKRIQDFGEKGREPASDEVTMGFYFAHPEQQEFPDARLRQVYHMEEVVQERVKRLRLNWERAVFRLPEKTYDYGEFASDYWHSTTVPVRDELASGDGWTNGTINKKLSSFAISPNGRAIPGGWKSMPLERVGLRTYSSYIEYGASIHTMIIKEVTGGNYKPLEMEEPRHWQIEASKFRRLDSLSPWFNDLEMQVRGKFLRTILHEKGGFDKENVNQIYGYASRDDLHMFSQDERDRILEIIDTGTIRNNRNEEVAVKVRLTEHAKATAEDRLRDKMGHILLGFCLGEVWPGSLDAKGLEARVTGEVSPILHPQFKKISRAISLSGILPPEYDHDFELVAEREFGFGTPEGTALTGGKRYIKASELYCAEKRR